MMRLVDLAKILQESRRMNGQLEQPVDYSKAQRRLSLLYERGAVTEHELALLEWVLYAHEALESTRQVLEGMGVADYEDATWDDTPEEDAWEKLWTAYEERPDLIKRLVGLRLSKRQRSPKIPLRSDKIC